MKMDGDEFDFDDDTVATGGSSLGNASRSSSNKSFLWRGEGKGRTRSARNRQEKLKIKSCACTEESASKSRGITVPSAVINTISQSNEYTMQRHSKKYLTSEAKRNLQENSTIEESSSQSDSLPSSSASISVSFKNTGDDHTLPSSRRHARKRQRQHPEDPGEDGEEVAILKSHNECHRLASSPRLSPERQRQSIETDVEGEVLTVTRLVRGAGKDAWAIQDAGSYRSLVDDCSYLCSTMTTLFGSLSAVDAACDLALQLSARETRVVLFSTVATAVPDSTVPTAFRTILDALAGALPENEYDGISSSEKNLEVDKLKTKRVRRQKKPRYAESDENLVEALSAVIHFLSWDCTSSKNSATNTSAAARKVRKAILQHKGVLRTISTVISLDPIVSNILTFHDKEESRKNLTSVSKTVAHPYKHCNIVKEANVSPLTKKKGGLAVGDNSVLRNSSDPTALGRQTRRNRRRLNLNKEKPSTLKVTPEVTCAAAKDDYSPEKASAVPSNYAASSESHLSFTSEDDSTSNQTWGSLSRPQIAEEVDEDDSVISNTGTFHKIQKKLTKTRARVLASTGVANHVVDHCARKVSCGHCQAFGENAKFIPTRITLEALNRIISGRDGDADSCVLLDSRDNNTGECQETDDIANNEIMDLETNPLVVTNRLLQLSGSLPLLSTAMAETLTAVARMQADAEKVMCMGCMMHLQRRLSVLASIIDGACCLNPINRRILCNSDGQTKKQQSGGIVASLLLLLQSVTNRKAVSYDNKERTLLLLDDIALYSIRTLTSLTHDNEVAKEQLMLCDQISSRDALSTPHNGLSILANLLYELVCQYQQCSSSNDDQCHSYDIIIFCLNTLTNIADTNNVRKALSELMVPKVVDVPVGTKDNVDKNEQEPFISWMSRWLVSETDSFREKVMSSSFGEKPTARNEMSSPDKHLEKDEEEHLVLAGNGFILLACLLRKSTTAPTLTGDIVSLPFNAAIKKMILFEMPLNTNAQEDETRNTSMTLIRNTLKAFCNFYHHSVGDLSVAIVKPVRKLIDELG